MTNILIHLKKLMYKIQGKSRGERVGKYYDESTSKYLEVVDSAIQSHRTRNESEMFDYYVQSMNIHESMRLLDAGCGVCGPAMYFAEKHNIYIDAVTNSQVQVDISNNLIQKKGLSNKIKVYKLDFHEMDKVFDNNSYDVVYFLESYGHAYNHEKALKAAAKLIKKQGILYIKDYFRRDVKNARIINKICRNMNKQYVYNLPDLYQTIHVLRQLEFTILKIGIPGFEHDNGEKAVKFEQNNNIDLFGKYKKYGRLAYADMLELIFKKVI